MGVQIDDLSLLDPMVQSNPRPFYALLHEQRPVYRMPETGMFVVSRYEDVRAVLRDTVSFSSNTDVSTGINGASYHVHEAVLAERGWSHVQTLQRTDPPEHGRYRRLLDQVFNIHLVRNLEPHIAEVANSLIDSFIARGTCEFVSEFALPLPGITSPSSLGWTATACRLSRAGPTPS